MIFLRVQFIPIRLPIEYNLQTVVLQVLTILQVMLALEIHQDIYQEQACHRIRLILQAIAHMEWALQAPLVTLQLEFMATQVHNTFQLFHMHTPHPQATPQQLQTTNQESLQGMFILLEAAA